VNEVATPTNVFFFLLIVAAGYFFYKRLTRKIKCGDPNSRCPLSYSCNSEKVCERSDTQAKRLGFKQSKILSTLSEANLAAPSINPMPLPEACKANCVANSNCAGAVWSEDPYGTCYNVKKLEAGPSPSYVPATGRDATSTWAWIK
jgi:hypothetical protein